MWSEVENRRLEALRHRARVLCPSHLKDKVEKIASIDEAVHLLSSLEDDRVGFLQTFNIWR